jgi:uncharacterized protein YrrD
MLYKATTLRNYEMQSLDGEVRAIAQFYFDDRTWIIRYVGAEASGGPFSDRDVLIPFNALLVVDETMGRLSVSLTKEQIEHCPELKTHLPVSSQSGPAYHDYYDRGTKTAIDSGLSPYIPGPDLDTDRGKSRSCDRAEDGWDRHLRCTHALTGYRVESTDGDIGRIDDFIVEDKTWAIRYLVLNAHHWWPGRKTLIPTEWIGSISAGKLQATISMKRKTIMESPAYNEHAAITRDYEARLYQHYDRKGYWLDRNADVQLNAIPQIVQTDELHQSSPSLQL